LKQRPVFATGKWYICPDIFPHLMPAAVLRRLLLSSPFIPFLLGLSLAVQAQYRAKPVPFTFLADLSEDRYNQRLKHKSLPVSETDFIILSKKSATEYAVERYDGSLKKTWATALPLLPEETVEAFYKNTEYAFVLTHRFEKGVGSQALFSHLVELRTGKKLESRKIFEVTAKGRKIGATYSEDGSKIVAYQFQMQETKIRSIDAAVFDGSFKKLKDQHYDLRDISTNVSANLKIDTQGNQYLCLLSDNATKLAIRRYDLKTDAAKVMSVQLGGSFSGKNIYVFQTQYALEPNGILYASALCLDQETSEYYSLKMVKFDFESAEMKFAPEFRFTPEYLASLNKAVPSDKPLTRLEDIELSEMLISPEKDVVIIAEKRYTEAGENSNYVAKELHLFTYDEFQNLAWRSFILKNQVAPPEEGFSGTSYTARFVNSSLNILTLETLNTKTDLYLRRINPRSGAGENPKALGLNVANDKSLAYIKDFTTWLNDNSLITVSRPSKKSATLQLSKIGLK
jgi:hypothetical protein